MVEGKMDEVLGSFSVPLDGRFESVRTGETNLGNWVCDVILAATGADLVLLNSGTLRSDQVHPVGNFTMRDLVTIIPMMDPLIVISVTGSISSSH
jgi:5'-nucleotidase